MACGPSKHKNDGSQDYRAGVGSGQRCENGEEYQGEGNGRSRNTGLQSEDDVCSVWVNCLVLNSVRYINVAGMSLGTLP